MTPGANLQHNQVVQPEYFFFLQKIWQFTHGYSMHPGHDGDRLDVSGCGLAFGEFLFLAHTQ